MSDIELAVRLRDAHQMCADAWNEFIENKMPSKNLDADKIEWERAQGSRGPYERSEDVNNPDFKALLKEIAAHNGKMSRNGYFYWMFRNGSVIGRKKKRYNG